MAINMFKNPFATSPQRVSHTLPEKALPKVLTPTPAKPVSVSGKKRPCVACGKGRSW